MAGGKGKIHKHPNANTNGFDKNPQNINREGQPFSFKSRYRELLNDELGVIWVDERMVQHRTKTVGKKEIKQVGFSLSKKDKIIAKFDKLMMSAKNDAVALQAIKFIWEQIDGKANQVVDLQSDGEPVKPLVINFEKLRGLPSNEDEIEE